MLIDISRPIHPGMAIYPNNPGVVLSTQNGVTNIALGSHTGTHIDALSHIEGGNQGIESFSLEQFIGPVHVVEIPSSVTVITKEHIPQTTHPRIIFKTSNSEKDMDVFDASFTAIDESCAEELVKRGMVLVGIDALSIKKKGMKDNVHALLLHENIVILEGLLLKNVPAGVYDLICLPLSIPHIDGAPARAILATYVNS